MPVPAYKELSSRNLQISIPFSRIYFNLFISFRLCDTSFNTAFQDFKSALDDTAGSQSSERSTGTLLCQLRMCNLQKTEFRTATGSKRKTPRVRVHCIQLTRTLGFIANFSLTVNCHDNKIGFNFCTVL